MTNTDRRGRLSRPAKALAALAIAAGAFTGLGLAGPAPAASAATGPDCPMGLLLANAPSKDMALGFANGTSNNAPLGQRDSSGLSRAEMWFEIPSQFGTVLLQNVNTDTGTFYAAVTTQSGGPVVAKTKSSPNSFDPTMAWKKRVEGGTITYTNLSSSKLITNVPGNEGLGGQPWQHFFAGQGGGAQKFIQDTRNC